MGLVICAQNPVTVLRIASFSMAGINLLCFRFGLQAPSSSRLSAIGRGPSGRGPKNLAARLIGAANAEKVVALDLISIIKAVFAQIFGIHDSCPSRGDDVFQCHPRRGQRRSSRVNSRSLSPTLSICDLGLGNCRFGGGLLLWARSVSSRRFLPRCSALLFP